jgi:PKD repeat protein
VELRFKTSKGYGNLLQKGQATTAGGQIKVENPNGYTQCVFVGSNGSYVSVASPRQLNDGVWHVFKCVRTATQVQVWVDGVQVAAKSRATGSINNTWPFVIGGKSKCDQVKVTCDYYTGSIDWVKVFPGDGYSPNNAPSARVTSSCDALRCSFDGSGSTDADGSIASYAWNFGDGRSGTGIKPEHTFASAGTYSVSLTVTDNQGATGTATATITVSQASTVSPIQAVAAVGDDQPNSVVSRMVTVPAAVKAGDAMVLTFSDNAPGVAITPPSGWTEEASRSTTGMTSRIWSRVATAGDAGSPVRVTTATSCRGVLVLTVYRGTDQADPVGPVVTAGETVSRSSHTTPTAPLTVTGSWVASYWADKTAATTKWTAPTGQLVRHQFAGIGTGHLSALSTDSGAQVPTGTVGGLTATADSSTTQAIMATIILLPRS